MIVAVDAGEPVNPLPGNRIADVANNIGFGGGLNYDLTDRTVLSLEGRYQVDEVCGQNFDGANVELCVETKSFQPRIGINTSISDTLSVYGQFSVGNNPAGVNVTYLEQGIIESLAVANGSAPVPFGVAAPNEGVTYDGVGGNPQSLVDYNNTTFAAYEEEELTNLEFGLKGSFAGGQGSYTAAAYYMVYENLVTNQTLNWDDDTPGGWNEGGWSILTSARTNVNQGDAEMYGLELSANYALNETWQLGGNLGLGAADYTDYCSVEAPEYRVGNLPTARGAANPNPHYLDILTPEDDGVLSSCGRIDGNQLALYSPVTANVNVTAFLPEFAGFSTSLRLDIRHEGEYYQDQLNLLKRTDVTTANLSMNMRSENWSIRAYVNNLTDNREPKNIGIGRLYTSNGIAATPSPADTFTVTPARPREIGLLFEFNFD